MSLDDYGAYRVMDGNYSRINDGGWLLAADVRPRSYTVRIRSVQRIRKRNPKTPSIKHWETFQLRSDALLDKHCQSGQQK